MELPRSLTLVSYAVNGRGVGHVARLSAINRWLRRYCTFAGVRTQHWFLTTSEADTMLFAEGFAAFKLPSKSIVEGSGIPKPAYLALAKQWIWSSVALLRPDLLLVDTFPNGSFDELMGVLDLCRHKALVLRPVRTEISERPGFRALLGLYDRIVVPVSEDGAPALPSARRDQVRTVGPIMLVERFEAVDRLRARARLGVPEGSYCLLVSGGGGGDDGVARFLDAAIAAVADDPCVHLVLAAGPLFRGEPRRGPRITFWTEPRLAESLLGVDGALSAGGFNAAHELMHFGIPTAFVPQAKIADDQDARVDALVAAGAALRAGGANAAALAEALAALRDPARAHALSAAAARTVPRNHARDAAAELLDLLLPPSVVRQAVDVVDDDVLGEAQRLGVDLGDLVDAAVALAGPRRQVDRAALDLDGARSLLRSAHGRGMPARQAVRLATIVGRKLCAPHADAEARGDAAALLLGHPAVSGQWTALLSLLELLGNERETSPTRAAEEIADFLTTGAATGLDLFRVVAEITRAQSELEPEAPNRALFALARDRLRGAEGQAS